MYKKIYPSEREIQTSIISWSKLYPTIGKFLIKIPNEGKRSWEIGKIMKKEGLTAGVSDLFLAIPRMSPYIQHGLWIEVKSKEGKLSKKQNEWQALMMGVGYHACVVRSVDEGIQAIKDYLGMK